MHRQPIVGYASRTGTRRNLAALRGADWRVLVSAKGELRTEDFLRYALDDGACAAYQQGQPFDEHAFAVAVERVGERADWLVLPDIVMGGMASLGYSLKWLERLRGMPCRMLIAVQNGMQVETLPLFCRRPFAPTFSAAPCGFLNHSSTRIRALCLASFDAKMCAYNRSLSCELPLRLMMT
jgi:hypothetical protein